MRADLNYASGDDGTTVTVAEGRRCDGCGASAVRYLGEPQRVPVDGGEDLVVVVAGLRCSACGRELVT